MKVFYRPQQVAYTSSFSPSASKPRWVVEDWLNDPYIQCDITKFDPVTEDQICLAHDPKFVRGVLSCRVENGFGNRDAEVAMSLPYTTGSLLAAAKYAIEHSEICASPTAGFHHSRHHRVGPYCSFNGICITALVLKQLGLVTRVGVIDTDAHHADGSEQIIKKLNLDWIEHHTMGRYFHDRAACVDGRFTRWLQRAIDRCKHTDLVIFQSGADCHISDPMGGQLTSPEMAERDRMVFTQLGHIPLVFCLGGGYQTVEGSTEAERLEPVLRLHRTTARIACEVINKMSQVPRPTEMEA